jgi:tRNA modification GTPase
MEAGLAPEYMTVDLRAALRAVGEITGVENAEEILDSVFSQFCIGK